MCGPSQASSPAARQNVFLRCAPQARTGRRSGPAQADGPGHVAARPAEDRGPAGDHARHRVVAAVLDLAVVGQEEVGDASEPRERLRVLRRHRLVRQVPRGHHQRPPRGLEQEVVERRVGEDQADERDCRARPRGRGWRRAVAARGRSGARPRRAARSSAASSRARARAASRSRTITANGFSSRCLRVAKPAARPRRTWRRRPGGSRRGP